VCRPSLLTATWSPRYSFTIKNVLKKDTWHLLVATSGEGARWLEAIDAWKAHTKGNDATDPSQPVDHPTRIATELPTKVMPDEMVSTGFQLTRFDSLHNPALSAKQLDYEAHRQDSEDLFGESAIQEAQYASQLCELHSSLQEAGYALFFGPNSTKQAVIVLCLGLLGLFLFY